MAQKPKTPRRPRGAERRAKRTPTGRDVADVAASIAARREPVVPLELARRQAGR